MAKLIGTAGHVDHGKTSLIQALTGIDADRLPEEKRRGMTIDIGFAYIDLPTVGRVSIVDVPGHEKFVTNMLVGAQGVDVALLCIAADEGAKPQTLEHLQILDLLPVEQMVVALTRADLVEGDDLELAMLSAKEVLAKTRFADAPIIATSTQTGAGLSTLRAALTEALLAPTLPKDGPWYMPIDRAFSVRGHGLVVTGTLAQGSVAPGSTAIIEPGHHEVRIRAVHSHGDPVESADFGARIALNLGGVEPELVRRGQTIGLEGSLFETSCLDARVRIVGEMKHGQRIRLSIGSEDAIGKVFLNTEEPDLVQFRLEQPIACALRQPLIVRRYSPPDLLAGGLVLVPEAIPRGQSETAIVIEGDSESEGVLAALGDSPQGTSTEEVCRLLGRTAQDLGSVFEELRTEGLVHGFSGLWFKAVTFDLAKAAFLEALLQVHAESPVQAFVPREKVLRRAQLTWTGKPLDRIIAALAADGLIEASGTQVRHREFKVQLTPKQRAFLDRVIEALIREEINTLNPYELSKQLFAPIQAIEETLRVGVYAGELMTIAPGVFYTPSQMENLKAKVREIADGKPFMASDMRDRLGTTRKYIIPLLEHFDSIQFTVRRGDERKIVG